MKMKEMSRRKIALANYRYAPNQCANDFVLLCSQDLSK